MATIHNAGAIKFLHDGTFVISVGDVNDPDNSQTNGVPAGRILRYTAAGTAPANNPFTGSDEFEWCRGLRNTFGLCVHPTNGILVGTDNEGNSGAHSMNDELNYLVAGKNFEWGAAAGTVPGAQIGTRILNWPALVVPTGLTYHTGTDFPPGYANNLFICSYDSVRILRFVMDGALFVDIDSQHIFGAMNPTGNDNKPLDIIEGNDGSLYVSTFTALWRIYRRTGP
jgi:glucose/arabinose dehydrogenase